MSVLVELIVVVIYIIVGTKVPLDKDFKQARLGEGEEEVYGEQEVPASYQPPYYPPGYHRS